MFFFTVILTENAKISLDMHMYTHTTLHVYIQIHNSRGCLEWKNNSFSHCLPFTCEIIMSKSHCFQMWPCFKHRKTVILKPGTSLCLAKGRPSKSRWSCCLKTKCSIRPYFLCTCRFLCTVQKWEDNNNRKVGGVSNIPFKKYIKHYSPCGKGL